MLTSLIVIISQYVWILNPYVGHVKLIQYITYTSKDTCACMGSYVCRYVHTYACYFLTLSIERALKRR